MAVTITTCNLTIFLITSFFLTPSATPTTTTTCTTCTYIKTHSNCHPKGYINYLQIFYCNLHKHPKLGFLLLLVWLAILFYILTNTASDYFCPAVDHLSKTLNLSPAIAGTTLLPLGNGAPDVFATIISFTAAGDGGDIGLNTILGGAIFVSTIVVGILSLLISYRRKTVIVDKPNFIRDVVFLIFSLSNLLVVVIIGRINLWASIVFASAYVVYICLVSYMHFVSMKKQSVVSTDVHDHGSMLPLLVRSADKVVPKKQSVVMWVLFVIGLPLYLPRRVTIPMVTKEKWCKPFGVVSMGLSPIMLALILNSQNKMGSKAGVVVWFIALVIGIALGSCTFAFTSSTIAPQKCLLLWYASGFLMSVTWTYITAEELVSLLQSLGTIVGISPSVLGLTVLAWGNSLGDLATNVAMAMQDGPNGARIAIAGCYAGPVFNIFVGLGFSFVIACWLDYPASYVVPENPYLCETIGFLIGGLLWALVVLPNREMRLDRTLGGGLLAIYFCFLFVKIARVIGLIDVSKSNSIESLQAVM
ncbi:putative sodium/calcium exchanger membrane region [Helianthus annuus]|uniref:Sodium/calcium exchanger membrane region n=1 Tax=Helianthus annuus TaxID=4232 RepID=A0A251SKX8_HELAN|nr:cation/calcium exchanger 1 [Helianthus annuus]KAF5770298.1 putative sodium/calcium exchanger membrane region [Helianthus annuus]KAJ0465234.1 putative sodium/calcium exchanger membrane region [Helianthus annuus]KAJ0486826.1 putative sodium/calcium exchanger membrane region [Helianthus annuus]KAJ0660959.1 putative sodium/calcium exchanger membrane region [Helianthus annuus]KAJ0855021.1 putative sodium/calcium exchanger membrane region [Helianthus annuus]